ncbi:MAG: DUF2436 domain-containing protein [Bacteroidales bacterium]|nr:DUF2436 domain-containing protein [Bacteroidales bacterium]
MKKFTIFMVALLVAAMSFAQTKSLSDVKKAMPTGITKVTKHTYKEARDTRDADQALVILSIGDVWGDGTGYQLLIDTDNAGWEEQTGPACSSSYTQWEYMIPANASANDANVVINTTESLYITPGTYSYLILNPSCGSGNGTNWIASNQCDESNATDYTFEAGKMYTFTVALSGQNDCVTLTVEDIPTTPTIATTTTELSFAAEINSTSEAEPVVINAMNLTEGITANVTAPFEVSADNNTFGPTANLTANGGTLYVRYSPTALGNHTGTMTITSAGANNLTVTLAGTAYTCSTRTAPWTEDFNPGSASIYCWSILNVNQDDGYYTMMSMNEENTDLAIAYVYSEENAANDWLISPELSIGQNDTLIFNVAHTGFEEKYRVLAISESPQNYANATVLQDTTIVESSYRDGVWDEVRIDLSAYNGQIIYIGIQCVSEADQYYMLLDNFSLVGQPGVLPQPGAVEENIANEVAVYPNPTSSMITVANAEGKDIVVVNSLGQVVANIKNAAANQTIDVANFANGTYFVKVDAQVVKLNVVK